MDSRHPIPEGEVRINSRHVAKRRIKGELVLYHAPSEQFVALDPRGERVWTKIEQGQFTIAELIREHSEETETPEEVAAFQIIAFLDELRAGGYLHFTLHHEREDAPSLDEVGMDLAIEMTGDIDIDAKPRGKSRSACKTMCV
jgi:hypothetical protein